ncbi:MAG TPA: prepilin-type N-terminal cleavage/methylation domain-containing protein [Gemmataceae bacterium]|jgi:prepilin-type N-terminal cleavage/methylation domain-containing protein|nr:prepilin-type N-terminal cleavage/methylation domain-containing protein [Gemmataceae bacterium]
MIRRRPKRPAFTLLEILLVLVILVALSAMLYPTLAGMYGDVRVKAAADDVQAAWTEARAHAIEDGRSYRFAVQHGTGKFKVAPDADSFWDGSGQQDENAAPPYVQESELPSSILFDIPADLPNVGGWSTVVVFNPDGGCNQDIEVVLKEDDDETAPVIVKVRAMTGAISVRRKTGDR